MLPSATGALVDRFGRTATDLRVSLTDRCNLRCSYCMPAEGLDWLPDERVLTDDEIVRLSSVAVQRLGVEQVRLTNRRRRAGVPYPGGPPLLRRALEKILSATRKPATTAPSPPRTALTTNALG